jgi:hypothetical protein
MDLKLRIVVSKKRDLKGEKGAALVELSFVLPFLLLLLFGLFETARLVNEVGWVNQVAYQTAKLGGETPQALGVPLMQHRANVLAQLQNNFLSLSSSFVVIPSYDADLVNSSISGEIESVFGGLPFAVTVSMVGPNLLRSAGEEQNLSQFANPSNLLPSNSFSNSL